MMSGDFTENITNMVDKSMSNDLTLPKFPSPIVAYSTENRPGLSVAKSTANIISKLKEDGFITAKSETQENMTNMFVHRIVEEVFRALNDDAAVFNVAKIGDIEIGAGETKLTNTNFAEIYGFII